MIGSLLLGQQPTFGGADFGIPEIAQFGYYQFRNAVPTSDSWEVHGGIEILFMQSGEACWDLPDDHFSMATGSQAVIFPAGRRHRISNGVYTPCRLLWLVFQPQEVACGSARLFLGSEIEALFEMANSQERPIDLPEGPRRVLGELCARLTDERLMIGSTPMMAEVRSKVYSSITSLWEVCVNGGNSGTQSRLVRQAAALLREGTEDDIADKDESIEDVARQLGYGKSRLYSLFTPRSRHGAQRLPPAYPHQALLRAADQTRIRSPPSASTAASTPRSTSPACSANMSASARPNTGGCSGPTERRGSPQRILRSRSGLLARAPRRAGP